MKKIILTLCALLIVGGALYLTLRNREEVPRATVPFDFTPYELKGRAVSLSVSETSLIDDHNFVAFSEDESGEQYVTWWRDYEIEQEANLQKGYGNDAIIPRWDGACGILRYIADEERTMETGAMKWGQLMLYDFEQEGFVHERPIADGLLDWLLCRGGFAVLIQEDEGQFLNLYDGQGKLEARLPLSDAYHSVVRAQRDQTGLWAVTLASAGGRTYTFMTVRDGEIIWQSRPTMDTYTARMDGRGGYFHLEYGGKYSDTYKPLIISHCDATGNAEWNKTLTGDKVLLESVNARFDPETGHLILTGSAVANSRKIYRVFRMEVDENWKTVSMDVRECNYHESYHLVVAVSPLTCKTMVLARAISDGYDIPAVLVPFDDLPKAPNPGITLR
ncbi:MAG: hypothetical protein IJS41_12600 [Clostridia bacterium]|nr:hypothetical protein [Clostridia bacterium]